jgi:ribosome maturation factor RimP
VGDELFDLLAPTVASFSLELLDVEVRPGLIRLVVDGPGGAQLDAIAEATRAVSQLLDAHDPQPGHRYTLEVTSPGVERPLRTPGQFARAVGETVTVRTAAGDPGARRYTGRLVEADEDGFVIEGAEDAHADGGRRFAYADIERARTVFEWGAPERPGAGGRARGANAAGRARGTSADGRARGATAGGPGTDRKKVTTP